MRRRFETIGVYGAVYGPFGSLGVPTLGDTWWVDTNASNAADRGGSSGQDPTKPLETIGQAITNAAAGDLICVAPGSYDEAITITKSRLTLMGLGGRGGPAIAPSATDGIAITIEGTAATATTDVTLINIGGEGNGTGGGLHVKGNIQRVRAYGCKFEGGAFGAKLESTAAGAVSDTILDDDEFTWTTTGLDLVVSGAGDPVTNTYVRRPLFHDCTGDCVRAATVHTANLWVVDGVFANQQDATEPTQYLDIAVANTTGFIANNHFATTVFSTAKFGITTGVIFANNHAEAESTSANEASGTASGRPN